MYVAKKLGGLRIFPDVEGKMSLDVSTIGGGVLLVPQFTLFGDIRTGRRPSFSRAEEPIAAEAAFDSVVAHLRASGVNCATGQFRADMRVAGVVDGPVTILLDSRKLF